MLEDIDMNETSCADQLFSLVLMSPFLLSVWLFAGVHALRALKSPVEQVSLSALLRNSDTSGHPPYCTCLCTTNE